MHIVIPKERRPFEKRVAASPETVKKLIALGFKVSVEQDAGLTSGILDEHFIAAGATIEKKPAALYAHAKIVLKVQPPQTAEDGDLDEVSLLEKGIILISILSVATNTALAEKLIKKGITCVALELVPRITRAQTMDVLSSQSNLAGYKAVLDATAEFRKVLPMMMTAAGTILPAKVLILGAGVAGLQAIATAKRLGAVVSAFDVRAAAKEQVQSLGATFIEVEADTNAETSGGYAKEMSADYQKRQAVKLAETIKESDIVICTALIPGRPAPVLVTEEMVQTMKPGSVIVDLAVEMGGNCPLSEYGKVVTKHNVILVGHANVASRVANDASQLYARNVFNFLKLIYSESEKKIHLNLEDEIVKAVTVGHEGNILRTDLFKPASKPKKSAPTKVVEKVVKKTTPKPKKK